MAVQCVSWEQSPLTNVVSFSKRSEAAGNERGGWALASLKRFGADACVPAKAGPLHPTPTIVGAVSRAGMWRASQLGRPAITKRRVAGWAGSSLPGWLVVEIRL